MRRRIARLGFLPEVVSLGKKPSGVEVDDLNFETQREDRMGDPLILDPKLVVNTILPG